MLKDLLKDNIQEYCKKQNLSISAFEKKCGLGNGTINGWKKSSPRLDSIEKISITTGISVTKLLKK